MLHCLQTSLDIGNAWPCIWWSRSLTWLQLRSAHTSMPILFDPLPCCWCGSSSNSNSSSSSSSSSTPCPAGDVQSVRIVESPCTPHWTPNYWRPGPVIRPPARWTMLVEELPKSMLRQSPNQQIPFYPTPGLNALFKGLLLTDAKRHMCHVLCSHCTNKWCWNQCNLFHRNSCSSGLKTAGFQLKQFDVEKRVQKHFFFCKNCCYLQLDSFENIAMFWKYFSSELHW